LNRLTALAPPSAFGSGSFGFSYDALSRRTQMTRPNNVTTNYSYDNLSRLLSVLHQAGSSTIDGASYGLDNAGNRSSKNDLRANVTSNYTYDALYELTQVTQGANTTESYSYDPVGNRLSSVGVPSYSYNNSNEITSTSSATYTYDNNGNTQTKTDSTGTTTCAWDFENRLTQVTLPGTGGTVSFKYDPFGRRIEKISPSTTSIFAYDGDNLIEEVNSSGAVVARYSQGENIDEPLAMLRGGATDYYEADGLGSVTSLSSPAGALVQTYTFDSFGKQTASSGSLTNPFRYTGREFDTETSLYYYRARYYDPAAGRFLSEDPASFRGGINLYGYVLNNPANTIDPSGLCAPKDDCGEWLKAIMDLYAEVWERFEEYDYPKWNIPLFGKGSRDGHLQQLEEKQRKLQREIDEYNDSDCPDPIPAVVTEIAARSLPALSPSPWHLPPPPDITPSTAVDVNSGLAINALGFTGLVLLLILAF
jgi:RHS repeat-associated protein